MGRTDPDRWPWTPWERPDLPDRVIQLEGTVENLEEKADQIGKWAFRGSLATIILAVEFAAGLVLLFLQGGLS